jgi:hypothetical protein
MVAPIGEAYLANDYANNDVNIHLLIIIGRGILNLTAPGTVDAFIHALEQENIAFNNALDVDYTLYDVICRRINFDESDFNRRMRDVYLVYCS